MPLPKVVAALALIVLDIAQSAQGRSLTGTAVARKVEAGKKIIGGTIAENRPGYVWMAVVSANGGLCAGALITQRVILTAAHCVSGFTAEQIKVRLGLNIFWVTAPVLRDVEQVISHPAFSTSTLDNDIALLFLSSPVPSVYFPILLPRASATPPLTRRHRVRAIGYGRTAFQGYIADRLMQVDVPYVPPSVCKKFYPGLTATMLCAGGSNNTCQGDSGGPLFLARGRGRDVHVGVISFGTNCADLSYPGVYASTAYFRNWIDASLSTLNEVAPTLVYSDSPKTGNRWGNWTELALCPSGSFAAGLFTRVESFQNWGDDTALNAVSLACRTPDGAAVGEVLPFNGFWGTWSSGDNCPAGDYIVSFRLRVQAYQGPGRYDDDMAATAIEVRCSKGTVLGTSGTQPLGDWGNWSSCPPGTVVGGLLVKVDAQCPEGDCTALNDVAFHCVKAP